VKFLENAPRFVFFTGKGGLGKTSIVCATALTLARTGPRVLLVSTDPASNVGQVLGLSIGNTVTPVPGAPGLHALLSGLEKHKQVYAKAVQALTDPARTGLVLATRAQTSSLSEIERTYLELNPSESGRLRRRQRRPAGSRR
jgi:anion-transporting  ArsA/GET3 family ATPase